ncbi:MAG: hypothetical protein OQL06_11950 [Gammaproteobacteria bacterium]|nr:hypothetical protein [Gammaproteobacteria bacterium]
MTRHIFLSVLIISAIALAAGMLYSPKIDHDRPVLGFPWVIQNLPDGSTQVFQITLGKSNLAQVEKQFNEFAKFTMFVPEQGDPVVEAYFNELVIAGLKAKMVIGFDLQKDQLKAMYDNGVRISTMGSGERKVTMHPDDIAIVKQTNIISITYMPAINLDDELIEKRFGQPEQKLNDPESDAVHWLYPSKGLDVVLSQNSKEVLQYVHPKNFDKILAPLLEKKSAK